MDALDLTFVLIGVFISLRHFQADTLYPPDKMDDVYIMEGPH